MRTTRYVYVYTYTKIHVYMYVYIHLPPQTDGRSIGMHLAVSICDWGHICVRVRRLCHTSNVCESRLQQASACLACLQDRYTALEGLRDPWLAQDLALPREALARESWIVRRRAAVFHTPRLLVCPSLLLLLTFLLSISRLPPHDNLRP